MSTTNTTHTDDLDPFHRAALSELRTYVDSRPRPQRRRRRVIMPAAAAAAAALVAAAVFTATRPAPAYAVEQGQGGDVVVTIHRLTDAQGLQDQLRAAGLDALVTYRPGKTDTGIKLVLGAPNGSNVPPSNADKVPNVVLGTGKLAAEVRAQCDIPAGGAPATVQHTEDGYRITIPGNSPLQDRTFAITRLRADVMTVSYASTDGQHACLVE